MPAISLIIPLYNAEKYLRPCLDSAKNQTFEDIEIICINDGSTDNTADIVNEYVAEDSRFRLIEQENAGCSMARNHGLKSAMSPYVALLDQDDVLHPQAMEVLHHLITKYNADVAEFVNETVQLPWGKPRSVLQSLVRNIAQKPLHLQEALRKRQLPAMKQE